MMLLVGIAIVGVPPAVAQDNPPLWLRPVEGDVVEEFISPPAPWASGHRGVDMAAPEGGEIRSPADGVVSFSGVVVDRQVLSINHGGGYVSSFEPVESDLKPGDAVSQGKAVALLSTYNDGTHHCASPCLHWGVRLHGDYINPLLLLGDLEPSILLPLNNR
ncbi:M23 family metallopeptidase [Nesterenkonia natronophila]|uniref:M23 family metallopeptidase n=2 Tax=Nesterenkonia natronophila TaxID=2174932 RepID=A0A3A4FAR8_9MICC|nr:M23 family metallopeptidase [Nesterenkonia natronophila]